MSTHDSSAADVKGREIPLVNSQCPGANGGAHVVDHCIDGADFMEVNVGDGDVVNFGFGGTQVFENPDRRFLRSFGNLCRGDDFAYVAQAARVFVRRR